MECMICGTDEAVEKHHVLPKSKGGRHKEILWCCEDCGGQVHMLFNNNDLATMSVEDLIASEKMGKYIAWKKKHPGRHTHRMSTEVKTWKKFHR